MILTLNIHYTRASDIVIPDVMTTDPQVPLTAYRDGFGNWCTRIVAPQGRIRIATTGVVRDTGEADVIAASAPQHLVQDLPDETLVFLLGSRYCDTDRLSQAAWDLFGKCPPGWARVQAICDFVHHHIAFGYEHAYPSKTAEEVFKDGRGVCRDYAHLAIAFCRCMNIPARYCAGYLGDIGIPPPYGPMDFAGFTFGVIGAFYGLLLAFVIVAAWERFDRADEMAQTEAMSLASLYRISKGFPQPLQQNLQQALRNYALRAINIEWPEMARYIHGETDNPGRADNPIAYLDLWALFGHYNPPDTRQTLVVDKSYDQLQQ